MPGWHISSGGGGAAAGGDVSGPGASTDNALVRWNGTGGTDIQNGVLTSADLNGDLTGPTSANDTSAVGSAFTNQPANDSVSLVSDDAGDTQNATIIGTRNGAGDTVTTEVVALTGLTPVESSTSDWEIILAITLDSPAVGTITASETSGGLTITTIAPLASSAGLDTTALTAWNRTISIVSDGATTKQIGIVGTDSGGSVAYDSQALTGTTAVTSNDVFATITGFLIGDLEGTRTVTFTTTGGTKIDGQFVMGAPSSSTDNAIARFDGATGKLIQNSAVTIADTTGSMGVPSAFELIWNSDTGLARSSAGVVKVTDGSTGSGTLFVQERTFAGAGGSGILFGGTAATQAALRGGYAVASTPIVYPMKADGSGLCNLGTDGVLLSGSTLMITTAFNDASAYHVRLSSAGVACSSSAKFYWYDSSPGPGGGVDTELSRIAAGQVGVANGTNGQSTNIKSSATTVTLSGASTTATGLFPAKCIQLGVSYRVTTAVTSGDGGTTFTVGDGSDADRYGTGIAFTLGTTGNLSNATADPRGWSASAGDVVFTCTGGTFSGGVIRVVAHYIDLTAPTS